MLTYELRYIKQNKTFPAKFCLALKFESEASFIEQYKAVRKLNLNANYSKKKFIFYMPPTVDNVVGLIRLRVNAEINMTDDAKAVFDSLREKALVEIQIRNQETEYISKLKAYGKFNKLNVKSYIPKIPWFNHQKFLFLLGTRVRKSFIMSDPGTGKTAVTLHVIDYRIKKGHVKKCVVVVPNHLLYNWAESPNCEINKHSNLKGMVLDGDKPTRISQIKRFLTDPSISILVTSYSFWSGRRMTGNMNRNDDEYQLLMSKSNVNMFVLDESHKIKNHQSLTSKNIFKWLSICEYGLLLSGTPHPNKLEDIFQQYKMISPEVFGYDFYKFQNKYFKCEDHWGSKWRIKSARHKEVLLNKSESKAIPYATSDCIDLPDIQDETIIVNDNGAYLNELRRLSPSHIQQLLDEGNKGLGVLSRLLTACSGFVYEIDALGNKIAKEFRTNPKLDALEETCEMIAESNGKAIIWHVWNFDSVLIKRMLDKNKFSYIHIDRNDDPKTRMKKIQQYENSSETTFLLTSPRLLAQGVNILSAGFALYYSYDFNYEHRVQSMARNCRIGSTDFHKKVTYYTFVTKDSIETDVINALREKRGYKEAIFGVTKNLIARIRQFRSKSCR